METQAIQLDITNVTLAFECDVVAIVLNTRRNVTFKGHHIRVLARHVKDAFQMAEVTVKKHEIIKEFVSVEFKRLAFAYWKTEHPRALQDLSAEEKAMIALPEKWTNDNKDRLKALSGKEEQHA